ncbi:hypothetical protein HDU88_005589 [Geranomyces variabilis]|nr:hypothetical protein HDU88_005589 [Geranomyces variabilis]
MCAFVTGNCLGISELLEDTKLCDSQRELVSKLRSSSAHLLSVINNVLDLTKIELGNVTVSKDAIDVAAVLDEVVKIVRPTDVGINTMQRQREGSQQPALDSPRQSQSPMNSKNETRVRGPSILYRRLTRTLIAALGPKPHDLHIEGMIEMRHAISYTVRCLEVIARDRSVSKDRKLRSRITFDQRSNMVPRLRVPMFSLRKVVAQSLPLVECTGTFVPLHVARFWHEHTATRGDQKKPN